MDNPLHVLKKAIQLSNWKMVEAAYTELTGEAPPKPYKTIASNAELVVHPASQPPKNEMEPCCDCGEDYPRSELLAGEVLCSKCRSKPNRLDGKETSLIIGTEKDLEKLQWGDDLADLSSIPDESLESSYVPGHIEAKPPIPPETESILDEIVEDNKEAAQPPPAHRVNLDAFRVEAREPSRVRSEGGNYAKTEPARPMEGNDFLDDLSEATRELRQDQILFEKGVRPAQRTVENRNPPGMVNAKCRECGESKPIPAGEARTRKQVSSDQGGGPSFLCDGCISSKAKGRRGG